MSIGICDMMNMNRVTEDAIRLRLFPFALKDKARDVFLIMRKHLTWEELAKKFLFKFFLPIKMAFFKTEIGTFKHLDFKPLYEAWNSFKDLFIRCPKRGYQD